MMHRDTNIVSVPRGTNVDGTFLSSTYGRSVRIRGSIGSGAYGTVLECDVDGGGRVALKVMRTEVFDPPRPTRREVEIYARKGKGYGKWTEDVCEFLKELSYARFMGREAIGPIVHGSTLVLETSHNERSVRSAIVVLAMEMLLPIPKREFTPSLEPEILRLMRMMANRRVLCIDIKPVHFMRSPRGGKMKCIDFGSHWCRRDLPGHPSLSEGGSRRVCRDVMVILMAAQVFMHTVMYGGHPVLAAWLHGCLRESPSAWKTAGRVYADRFVDPIPTTYFKQSGEYVWNSLTNLLRTTEPVGDGLLSATEGGPPLSRLQMKILVMGDDDDA